MKRTIWGLDRKEIMKQVMTVMGTLHAISLMWKSRCFHLYGIEKSNNKRPKLIKRVNHVST